MDGDASTLSRTLEMHATVIQMVEALWILTHSSVYYYNQYETDSTSSKQASLPSLLALTLPGRA